ncbi:MAG: cytidylate kinase-like family protein [candidate division Zixibacteria bacterium]|nr:cytidylate kinase-like family protein [candidate division Zixibacteria bacterium]
MKHIEVIIDQQIKKWELDKKHPVEDETKPLKPGPIITISRQRGSGGSIIAQRLAELTGFAVINREIIDQISQEIGTQKRLVETLDEADRSNFELWVDGIFRGRIVDSSDYNRSLIKIIGAITHHGKTIIVGRGANFIVGNKNAFNVRIVADYQFRIDSLVKRRKLNSEQAKEEIEANDQQRKKFIKKHFDRDINDYSAYDLIINSANLEIDKIAGLILNAYPQKTYQGN